MVYHSEEEQMTAVIDARQQNGGVAPSRPHLEVGTPASAPDDSCEKYATVSEREVNEEDSLEEGSKGEQEQEQMVDVETTTTVRDGPDTCVPTDAVMTWQRDGAVRLRMTKEGHHSQMPISIMTLMRQIVAQYSDRFALASEVDGEWQFMTYRQYYDFVIQAAKSFIKLGLEVRRSVGILGFNHANWFIANLGAIFAGGLSTGIYATNAAEACAEIANSAECNVIVVENDAQLQKILKVRGQLRHLKAIVQYNGQPTDKSVYSWSEFLAVGKGVSDEELESRIRLQAPNKCCTLIYTVMNSLISSTLTF
jgi:hypothetical protein